ncbi:pyridoxal 5'-phosphate synthase glutaminase subunit PdxT [Candidatus Woesearchaeota archaeon]|nr:pyridoxal 5'-phosphate synthase glutaminase subunit PdxT [Candidatus Woesearchaeota archaeon]
MVGVLALQGDFREHLSILKKLGVDAKEIRTKEELSLVDGLIIPGGESTVINKLMRRHGLAEELVRKAQRGFPILGTCAGAIVISKEILGDPQVPLGLLDISVKRNAYGPQIESFEDDVEAKGIGKVRGCFIRAPIITRVGKRVDVLAKHQGNPVLFRQGNILASTFHPEIAGETRIHKLFLEMIKTRREKVQEPVSSTPPSHRSRHP